MGEIVPISRLLPASIIMLILYIPFILLLVFNTNAGFFLIFSIILTLSLFEFHKLFHINKRYIYINVCLILTLFLYVYKVKSITTVKTFYLFTFALLSSGMYLLFLILERLINNNTKMLYKAFLLYLMSLLYLFLPITINLTFSFSMAGLNLLLYEIIVCKVADTGALIIGKKYGKIKIAPYISPNKTLEGLFGSIIAGSIFSSIFYFISPVMKKTDFIVHSFIGTIVILLNNAGDLFESYLKRLNNVKDSSNMLGQIGGILDLIDGILLASPALFIYYNYLEK